MVFALSQNYVVNVYSVFTAVEVANMLEKLQVHETRISMLSELAKHFFPSRRRVRMTGNFRTLVFAGKIIRVLY